VTKTPEYYTTPQQLSRMNDLLEAYGRTETRRRLKAKQLCTGAVRVLFALGLLLFCTLMIRLRMVRESGQTPDLFGFSVYRVLSGSMTPTLPVNSLFLAKQYSGQSLQVGDIVVFTREGRRVTHRIVSREQDDAGLLCYRTKGDNPQNCVDNALLYPEQVEAVYLMRLSL